jgi:hypothetical protein
LAQQSGSVNGQPNGLSSSFPSVLAPQQPQSGGSNMSTIFSQQELIQNKKDSKRTKAEAQQ